MTSKIPLPTAEDQIRWLVQQALQDPTPKHGAVLEFHVPDDLCEELRGLGYHVHKTEPSIEDPGPVRGRMRVFTKAQTFISWAPDPYPEAVQRATLASRQREELEW